jgi:adenylate kinase family enzyme
LIDFYRRQGLLMEIDGEGDVARVFERARDASESAKLRSAPSRSRL